jgi:hypothetical protein
MAAIRAGIAKQISAPLIGTIAGTGNTWEIRSTSYSGTVLASGANGATVNGYSVGWTDPTLPTVTVPSNILRATYYLTVFAAGTSPVPYHRNTLEVATLYTGSKIYRHGSTTGSARAYRGSDGALLHQFATANASNEWGDLIVMARGYKRMAVEGTIFDTDWDDIVSRTTPDNGDNVVPIAFSLDSTKLYGFGETGLTRWDVATGAREASFSPGGSSVRDHYTISPDGQYIAYGEGSGLSSKVRIVRLSDMTQVREFGIGNPGYSFVTWIGTVLLVRQGGNSSQNGYVRRYDCSNANPANWSDLSTTTMPGAEIPNHWGSVGGQVGFLFRSRNYQHAYVIDGSQGAQTIAWRVLYPDGTWSNPVVIPAGFDTSPSGVWLGFAPNDTIKIAATSNFAAGAPHVKLSGTTLLYSTSSGGSTSQMLYKHFSTDAECDWAITETPAPPTCPGEVAVLTADGAFSLINSVTLRNLDGTLRATCPFTAVGTEVQVTIPTTWDSGTPQAGSYLLRFSDGGCTQDVPITIPTTCFVTITAMAAEGCPGDEITATGNNLDDVTQVSLYNLGGGFIQFLSWTRPDANTITFTVPGQNAGDYLVRFDNANAPVDRAFNIPASCFAPPDAPSKHSLKRVIGVLPPPTWEAGWTCLALQYQTKKNPTIDPATGQPVQHPWSPWQYARHDNGLIVLIREGCKDAVTFHLDSCYVDPYGQFQTRWITKNDCDAGCDELDGTAEALPGTLARRDDNSRLRVGNGVADADAANVATVRSITRPDQIAYLDEVNPFGKYQSWLPDTTPTITSNQNAFNPGDFPALRIASDAARTINGILGGVSGRLLTLTNVGNFNITLKHESLLSDAVNRIKAASQVDVVLVPGQTALLQYDILQSRWCVLFPTTPNLLSGFWGDGSDGNVTISGTVTLTRDMFYDTLIVPSGATLRTANFRIFCKNLCQVNAGGVIHNDGLSPTSSASVAATNGTLGIGTAGGAGSATTGAAPTTTTHQLGGIGGAGGAGTAGAGGASSLTAPGATAGTVRHLPVATQASVTLINVIQPFRGGAGGGGGGGDAINLGGAAGNGGGILLINARRIINNGIIRARGGNGFSPTVGNVGGGGAGGGGVIILNSIFYDGSGMLDVSSGTPGAGFGTGQAGQAGQAGQVFNNVWV